MDPNLHRQVGLLIELIGAAVESPKLDRMISAEALDQTNVGEVALQSA